MRLNKHETHTKEEREIIHSFFKKPISKTTMSIWTQPEFAEPTQDYSNSKFLNKRFGDGDELRLKFIQVLRQLQGENTPEQYKTEDGYQFMFYFDLDGKELEMAQNSTRGKFFKAMRATNVEPGEVITIKRVGSGIDTEWEISRGFTPPETPELKADPIPF